MKNPLTPTETQTVCTILRRGGVKPPFTCDRAYAGLRNWITGPGEIGYSTIFEKYGARYQSPSNAYEKVICAFWSGNREAIKTEVNAFAQATEGTK